MARGMVGKMALFAVLLSVLAGYSTATLDASTELNGLQYPSEHYQFDSVLGAPLPGFQAGKHSGLNFVNVPMVALTRPNIGMNYVPLTNGHGKGTMGAFSPVQSQAMVALTPIAQTAPLKGNALAPAAVSLVNAAAPSVMAVGKNAQLNGRRMINVAAPMVNVVAAPGLHQVAIAQSQLVANRPVMVGQSIASAPVAKGSVMNVVRAPIASAPIVNVPSAPVAKGNMMNVVPAPIALAPLNVASTPIRVASAPVAQAPIVNVAQAPFANVGPAPLVRNVNFVPVRQQAMVNFIPTKVSQTNLLPGANSKVVAVQPSRVVNLAPGVVGSNINAAIQAGKPRNFKILPRVNMVPAGMASSIGNQQIAVNRAVRGFATTFPRGPVQLPIDKAATLVRRERVVEVAPTQFIRGKAVDGGTVVVNAPPIRVGVQTNKVQTVEKGPTEVVVNEPVDAGTTIVDAPSIKLDAQPNPVVESAVFTDNVATRTEEINIPAPPPINSVNLPVAPAVDVVSQPIETRISAPISSQQIPVITNPALQSQTVVQELPLMQQNNRLLRPASLVPVSQIRAAGVQNVPPLMVSNGIQGVERRFESGVTGFNEDDEHRRILLQNTPVGISDSQLSALQIRNGINTGLNTNLNDVQSVLNPMSVSGNGIVGLNNVQSIPAIGIQRGPLNIGLGANTNGLFDQRLNVAQSVNVNGGPLGLNGGPVGIDANGGSLGVNVVNGGPLGLNGGPVGNVNGGPLGLNGGPVGINANGGPLGVNVVNGGPLGDIGSSLGLNINGGPLGLQRINGRSVQNGIDTRNVGLVPIPPLSVEAGRNGFSQTNNGQFASGVVDNFLDQGLSLGTGSQLDGFVPEMLAFEDTSEGIRRTSIKSTKETEAKNVTVVAEADKKNVDNTTSTIDVLSGSADSNISETAALKNENVSSVSATVMVGGSSEAMGTVDTLNNNTESSITISETTESNSTKMSNNKQVPGVRIQKLFDIQDIPETIDVISPLANGDNNQPIKDVVKKDGLFNFPVVSVAGVRRIEKVETLSSTSMNEMKSSTDNPSTSDTTAAN